MTDTTQPVVAVLVAAGSGSRLGASVPKALVELDGVALVRRAADALADGGVAKIVVTVPDGYRSEMEAALAGCACEVTCTAGGQTRQDSVRLGLAALDDVPDDAVVLVHDAARALVPASVVRAVVSAIADGAEAAVPVVPVVDSIRRLDDDGSAVVDRAPLRAVQTPQGSRLGALRLAHSAAHRAGVSVTDDAAVCEHAGLTVALVDGHRDALKVTEPIDLILAQAIVRERGAR